MFGGMIGMEPPKAEKVQKIDFTQVEKRLRMMERFIVIESDLEDLYIVRKDHYIHGIYIGKEDFLEWKGEREVKEDPADPLLEEAGKQILEYFAGERKGFDLPYILEGTPFQRAVWQALLKIPYGSTRSYLEIAQEIGKPKAVRAVGQANKANRLPIIVPCHRVIGKKGDLVGYAGQRTHLKARLLVIEKVKSVHKM